MCNQKATWELKIVLLEQADTRSGSAIGVAQALGQPLKDGEKIELSGAPAGSELLVNVFTGHSVRLDKGVLFPRIAKLLFRLPRLPRVVQDVEVHASMEGERVFASLTLPDGTVIGPESIYVPVIRTG
jgi:hypothetical protein